MLSRVVSFPILPSQLYGTFPGLFLGCPSKKFLNYMRKKMVTSLNGTEITILSKDNINLNGALFKRDIKNVNENINKKIWINFNGNGKVYELIDPDQIKKIKKLGFDVLLFNYRLVGKSCRSVQKRRKIKTYRKRNNILARKRKNILTQKGLIKDGIAVIKYASSLGYNDIYIHAHSLGGAIATKAVSQIKDENTKIYKKIKLIVDRTFSSIKIFISKRIFGFIRHWEKKLIEKQNKFIKNKLFKSIIKIFRVIEQIIIKKVKIADWNIKIKKDWEKIDIKKCLIYSSLDELITHMCSLYKKVKDSTDNSKIIKLKNYTHCQMLTEKDLKEVIKILDNDNKNKKNIKKISSIIDRSIIVLFFSKISNFFK